VEDGQVAIYSASDFWTDVLPALILKLKKRNVKWIAGFYLFPPSPFEQSVYKGFKGKLKNIAYFLSHKPAYWLVRKHADLVFVTNDLDKERFVNSQSNPRNVFVIRGGVDLKLSKLVPEQLEKKFDAVFVGRLHEQTGVLELIDIWKQVCTRRICKLAIIGVGGLENEVRAKINRQGLKDHITLFGFKDGIEKIEIFKTSKIVLHPAIYTSGGMAAAEAMACGLPGISFDLPSLRTYYPKGMIKIPMQDFKGYAEAILNLLENNAFYSKLSEEAVEFAQEWDWDKRAKIALEEIHRLFEVGTSK
jgi:glycosyltransferase involved in cell wall biosynthesis